MQKTRVNGVELEYDIQGSGEPLLLISPVIADGFFPLHSQPVLAGSYRLITYHKRGWAGSTHTPPPVTIADHARDAAALLDHLGIRSAHIAGHSSGAAVALQLALDFPEVVHSLALLELSLLSVSSAAGFRESARPAFEAYGAGDHATAVGAFLSAVSGLDVQTCGTVVEKSVPGATAQAIHDAHTLFGVELPALVAWKFGFEEAKAISQPVLSVVGTDTEPLWVEVAGLLRSWFAQAEECTIEGAGHLLHFQRPEAVAGGIAAFLARHPLRANENVQKPVGVAVRAKFAARASS